MTVLENHPPELLDRAIPDTVPERGNEVGSVQEFPSECGTEFTHVSGAVLLSIWRLCGNNFLTPCVLITHTILTAVRNCP